MNILSLDIATRTGWATNINGRMSGSQEFDLKRGESPGMRFLRMRNWLWEIHILLGKIEVIAYEQAHHRGGAATAVCVGLVTEVLAYAAASEIEVMPIHTATLKKFATGSGRAGKDEMIEAARKFGWNPQNHDEADAILLLELAEKELNVSIEPDTLFRTI